jgi:hypothetical protein
MVDWSQYFYYEDGHLFRKVATGPTTKAGDKAGGLDDKGYLTVRYNNTKFKAHRIIWEMHFGVIPKGYEIDHIDHNRLNNKLENLRLATRSQNVRNTPITSKNKSGYKGVSWNKQMSKWVVQIRQNNMKKHIGYFENVIEAAKAYDSALKTIDPTYGSFNFGE